MKDLSLVLIQTDLFWEEPELNLRKFGQLIGSVAGRPDLILLPEMFNTGFSINPVKFAEPMAGPSADFLRHAARESGAMIIASMLVREDEKFYNRMIGMKPDGTLTYYDKRHLFRLSDEFLLITRGNKRVVTEYQGWKILFLVCYDLRFPVWTKNRYLNGTYEYDLIVYVANWPANRSHVWKTLLAARAMENQCYVAGVNRIGTDGFGTGHTGESLVLDPRGRLLASGEANAEALVKATLSAADLQSYRDSFTVGMDWDAFNIQEG